MASHCHHHSPHPHPYPHHHHQTSPSPSTNCCCNSSSPTCCTPPPPPPPPPHFPSPLHSPHHDHHLLQTVASLLSQQHLILNPKSHTHHNTLLTQTYNQNQKNQTHSTISSLLSRIESLESSLNHYTKHTSYNSYSLRDTAARIIQIHFRSFLVRRSKTLRNLKHLAFIKSTFNALKSSFSNDTHLDFAALSYKAMDLLLQLDSIEGCDPMVVDGKRSFSRDLVQFLDSIERVAMKKHLSYVKAVKNARFGQKVNKSRDSSDDDERRKLLQNLRGRVEKISRLCKASENDEDSEPEGIHHVGGDDEDDNVGVPSVLISRRNGVAVKNGRFGQQVNKSRDSSDDEKRKLLQNLRGRVEKISRLCKVSENDEDSEPKGTHNVSDDNDGNDVEVPTVLISRRNGASSNKNRVFLQRQGVQPRGKKSVKFAENGKFSEVYGFSTYEPDLSGDVTCLDGSSSSGDDQGEVLENVGYAVEDVLDSSQGAEDDEEALVENGGSRHSSDDGENSTRDLKNDGRNTVRGQLQTHQEKLLFSAPLPLKMENKADLMKSKGVRILTWRAIT